MFILVRLVNNKIYPKSAFCELIGYKQQLGAESMLYLGP